MRRFWQDRRKVSLAPRRSFALVALLCLILLALLAVVQVTHLHPLNSDADHCPLCMVLHAVTPVSVAAAAIILVQLRLPVWAPEVHAVSRPWHPSLFNRPPPFAC